MMKNVRMYEDLAWTWPIISPPEEYEEEAEQFIKAILDHSKIEVKTVLDMGCGGGHVDVHLKRDFAVTGADLSEGMLANARRLNPEVRYVNDDMRDLRLSETFDAVIIADAIMYMKSQDELKAAFETAFEHLKPGGAFCTYVEESPDRFDNGSTYISVREKDNARITLIEHQIGENVEDGVFESIFVYVINTDGQITVEIDRHEFGIFPLETWRRLLEEAGFEVHETVYDADDGYPMFIGVKPL